MTESINDEYIRLDDGVRKPSEIINEITKIYRTDYKTVVRALGNGIWSEDEEGIYGWSFWN